MRSRPRLLACTAVLAGCLATGGPTASTAAPVQDPVASSTTTSSAEAAPAADAPELPDGPVRPTLTLPDPALTEALDALVAVSPADTCLTVEIDGRPAYAHDGAQPLLPASNEKLLTAGAALDLLGPETRYRTRAVALAAPVDGVVVGDLTLVGSGDPGLVTSAYAAYRGIGADRPTTTLESLVGQLQAAGVTRIVGRVVGDESRYDQARQVASWPANYLGENQAGNLSALGVDDGYVLRREGDEVVARERASDPALATAAAFTALARVAGITVDGEAASGTAPAGSVEVAAVESPTLAAIVQDLLRSSDNHAAELVAKELGVVEGGGGSTAAGAAVVTAWAVGKGVAGPGTTVVDGSGLDRGNRVTCDELVALLDASGGPDSTIGQGLPVAGESGTLAGRFRGTSAAGKLRAKSGTLNPASSLAGWVDQPEGHRATFAFIANADLVPASILAVQERLGTILADHLTPCPASPVPGVVAPVSGYLAQLGALSAVPTGAAALPGVLATLEAVEGRARGLADRCLAGDPDAVAVLGG